MNPPRTRTISSAHYCLWVMVIAFGLAFLSRYFPLPSWMPLGLVGAGVIIALLLVVFSPEARDAHQKNNNDAVPEILPPARRIGFIYLTAGTGGYCHDSAFGDPGSNGACVLLSAPFILYPNDVVLLEPNAEGEPSIIKHIPYDELQPDEIAFLEACWGPRWQYSEYA